MVAFLHRAVGIRPLGFHLLYLPFDFLYFLVGRTLLFVLPAQVGVCVLLGDVGGVVVPRLFQLFNLARIFRPEHVHGGRVDFLAFAGILFQHARNPARRFCVFLEQSHEEHDLVRRCGAEEVALSRKIRKLHTLVAHFNKQLHRLRKLLRNVVFGLVRKLRKIRGRLHKPANKRVESLRIVKQPLDGFAVVGIEHCGQHGGFYSRRQIRAHRTVGISVHFRTSDLFEKRVYEIRVGGGKHIAVGVGEEIVEQSRSKNAPPVGDRLFSDRHSRNLAFVRTRRKFLRRHFSEIVHPADKHGLLYPCGNFQPHFARPVFRKASVRVRAVGFLRAVRLPDCERSAVARKHHAARINNRSAQIRRNGAVQAFGVEIYGDVARLLFRRPARAVARLQPVVESLVGRSYQGVGVDNLPLPRYFLAVVFGRFRTPILRGFCVRRADRKFSFPLQNVESHLRELFVGDFRKRLFFEERFKPSPYSRPNSPAFRVDCLFRRDAFYNPH